MPSITVQPEFLLERILSLEIVRVTERAAVSSARLRGHGKDKASDQAAVDAMRPWIAMKVAKIPFEETVISLNAPNFKDVLGPVSGTGKVPTLIDGDVRVWESLAILEYLAEKFPNARLWPADSAARALARAISNEMHAGFLPLRRLMASTPIRTVSLRRSPPLFAYAAML